MPYFIAVGSASLGAVAGGWLGLGLGLAWGLIAGIAIIVLVQPED